MAVSAYGAEVAWGSLDSMTLVDKIFLMISSPLLYLPRLVVTLEHFSSNTKLQLEHVQLLASTNGKSHDNMMLYDACPTPSVHVHYNYDKMVLC